MPNVTRVMFVDHQPASCGFFCAGMKQRPRPPRAIVKHKSRGHMARELRKAVRAGCILTAASIPLLAVSDERPDPLPVIDAMALILVAASGGSEATEYTPTHFVAPYASVSGASADTDVAADGAPAFSTATSSGSPTTMAEALASATGDDVIQAALGTYAGTSTSDRFVPAWRFTNSGSSGSPIIIYAVNPATSTANTSNRSKLTHDGAIASSAGCPTIGSRGEDYIIWDGFWIDEANANPKADTGPVAFSLGAISCEARRLVIDGMDVSGGDTWASVPAENHNAFRFEGCTDCWAKDCEINNLTNPSDTHNGAAVMVYSSTQGVSGGGVEYCTFTNCGAGIYVKGQNGSTIGNFTIRFNIFDDMNVVGIEYGGHSGARSRAYCNIVKDSQDGCMLGRDDAQDVDVFNNTFVRVNRGFYLFDDADASGFTIRNNIVYDLVSGGDTPHHVLFVGTVADTIYAPDYNCYYDSATDRWRYNNTTYTSFASYDGALSSTYEDNSINSDPLFTDAANDDFTLGGSSPCDGAGNDYLSVFGQTPSMGAYATGSETIGVRSNPSY